MKHEHARAALRAIIFAAALLVLLPGCRNSSRQYRAQVPSGANGHPVAPRALPPATANAEAGATVIGGVPAVYRPPTPVFMNTWLVLGTFPNNASNAGLNHDWIGEAKVVPEAGSSVAGHRWHYFDDRLFSRNYDNYQDLFSYFHIERHESVAGVVAYAAVYLYTPRAQMAQLRMAADTSAKAWLNGGLITRFLDGSGLRQVNVTDIRLRAGWNRLLLKIANTEDGRFGFYARVCARNGGNLPDLTISPDGPGHGALQVETGPMARIKSPTMPTGWRSWPYVGAEPDLNNPAFNNPAGGPLVHLLPDHNDMMQASNFEFTAQGGTPPYTWILGAGGGLPPGLSLESNGTIKGTIASAAKRGDYRFRIWVRDAKGMFAAKNLSLTVRARPNKWYEEARLVGLMEATNELSAQETLRYCKILKRRGYQVIMVDAFNNGRYRFHYPSRYAKNVVKGDPVARWKAAVTGLGMKFGLYFGNITNLSGLPFSNNQAILVLQEAVRRYHPSVLWFDWSGINEVSPDAMFSAIRTLNPNLVIVVNGSVRGSNGDWDESVFEGWGAWGSRVWDIWPVSIPWPKKNAPEGWRLMVEPGFEIYNPGNVRSSWRQMLRIQLSMIGQGFVADIDAIPGLVHRHAPLRRMRLAANQRKMADWTSPAGIPPLYPSFTWVNLGPLHPASWGYNMVNLKRNAIYLHILRNPLGKTGLPDDPTLTVRPIFEKVKDVVWMNTNQPLKFTQHLTLTDHGLTIDTAQIKPDPIDTIIRIDLEHSLPKPVVQTRRPIPAGNLACFKPAWLLNVSGSRIVVPCDYKLVARNGVDSILSTVAEAGGGHWAWTYEVDLRRLYRIGRVVVNFAPKAYATEYNILLSVEGVHWKQVAHVAHNDRGGAHIIRIQPELARYVRVQAVKPDGSGQPGGQMAIAELQVFAAKKKP